MTPEAKGPINPVELLKTFVERIEQGKMKGWIFIYPLHSVYVRRFVETPSGTQMETETEFNVAFLTEEGGLSPDELRWIASKLVEKAVRSEELIEKWKRENVSYSQWRKGEL